jgi:hypothetical protein
VAGLNKTMPSFARKHDVTFRHPGRYDMTFRHSGKHVVLIRNLVKMLLFKDSRFRGHDVWVS